jgi:WD40 repeat protein
VRDGTNPLRAYAQCQTPPLSPNTLSFAVEGGIQSVAPLQRTPLPTAPPCAPFWDSNALFDPDAVATIGLDGSPSRPLPKPRGEALANPVPAGNGRTYLVHEDDLSVTAYDADGTSRRFPVEAPVEEIFPGPAGALLIAPGDHDGLRTAWWWDYAATVQPLDGTPLQQLAPGANQQVRNRSFALSTDGARAVTQDERVRVTDRDGERLFDDCGALPSGRDTMVDAPSWSPDGTRLAGCADDGVRVWDTTTGRCTQKLSGFVEGMFCQSALFMPDGRVGAFLMGSNYQLHVFGGEGVEPTVVDFERTSYWRTRPTRGRHLPLYGAGEVAAYDLDLLLDPTPVLWPSMPWCPDEVQRMEYLGNTREEAATAAAACRAKLPPAPAP